MGGKGDVVYMRGAAGASADSDRDKGFKKALAEFPDVKVAHEVFTGWQQDQGKQQILDFIATGTPFDGIWTSGIDNVIVDALVESQAPLVPVVGADNAGFVGQLNSVEGLKGAAVTNPGSIGGAGVTLALQILDGKKPAQQTVLVEPQLWENATDEGKAKLKAAADPSLSPEWPVSDLDPGLDHLHQGPDRRLQGPGRISSGPRHATRGRGADGLRVPALQPDRTSDGTVTTEPAPRRHRRRQELRRRRGAAQRLAVACCPARSTR